MERYLSASDAARVLNVTTGAVRLMMRRGELPAAAKTDSGIHLFRREDVEGLAARRSTRAAQSLPPAA